MHREMWLSVVLGIVLGLPGQLPAERPADFGQQWVRTHPFTLNSMEVLTTSAAVYEAAGYNSSLSYYDRGILDEHAIYGHPWHIFIEGTSLSNAQAVANTAYANYANGLGWYMDDEPNCDSPTSSDLLGLADIAAWLKASYPDMLVYANLLGYSPSSMYKVDNYINAVHPDVLMYDHYPFHPGSEMDTDNFFVRAMKFRAKGLKYNLPVFAWPQAFKSSSDSDLRYPSASEHRLEKYAYLAMGYKGLSDFIYTWGASGRSTIVTDDGVPTGMYYYVADVNPEILRLGNVLKFATTTDVRFIPGSGGSGHDTPSGLDDWSQGAGGDSHITNIQVGGSGSRKNGLIGFFEDDRGEELFMLVNEYCGSSLSASAAALSFSMTFDASINSLLRLDQLSGQQVVVPLSNHVLDVTLLGGTGNLYKYNDGVAFLGLPIPFTGYTSFEASEGYYTNGNINGRLGWTVSSGTMNVNTTAGSVAGSGTGRGEIAINSLPAAVGSAVTGGDAYFTIYYNTSGAEGIQLFVGDEDLVDNHMAVYIYNRNTGGVLKYQDGSTYLSGPTPPETGWWAIRVDLHWDADTSRYTSWDFKYAEVGDTDWTTIDTGLDFRSQDEFGYNFDLAAVMPWNRPTGADTQGLMLVDNIYLGNEAPTLIPEPAALSLLLAAGISMFVALSLRGKRS